MVLNCVVRLYGLDGIVRHSPVLAACRISRIALDYIWRPRLHLGIAFYLESGPKTPFFRATLRARHSRGRTNHY